MLNTSGTKSNRSTSFSRSKNVLGESDVTTLQREVDNYIRKLEQEKRRLAAIEETYSMVLKEMSDKKKRLEQTQNPTRTEQQKSLTQIKNLENQLEMTVTKYNEIVAKNNKLRDEIDVLRRERTSFLQVYRNMQVELDSTNKETVHVKVAVDSNNKKIETTQSKIHTLQNKNEKEKAKYFQQFEDLERDMKDMMKRKDLGLKTMPKSKEKAENIDTHTLLKRRLQKIIFNNKDKVKIIEQYIKNMRYIDEAFTQIKEATGITDVDEIVNTFIKSEEQNLSLMNYASLLSQDIDMFEEMNKDLGKEIDELEIMKRQRVAEIEGNEQEKEKKRVKSMIESKKKEMADLKGRIEQLQQSVEPMLIKFAGTGIQNHVLGKYNYDAGVAINDNNAEQYLAELEDYLDTFLLYHAKSKETPENPYILKPGMWEEANLDNSEAHQIFDPTGKEPNLKDLGNILDSSNLESHFMKWEDMERIGNETLEKKKVAQPIGNSFNGGHSVQQSSHIVEKPTTKLPEISSVHRSVNKKGTKIGDGSPSKL